VPEPVRVLIADDQALVRSGFRLILESAGLEVAGEAANGKEAVAAVAEYQPDVVLMDIRMPVMDGLEATRQIVGAGSEVRVLMLTTFDLDQYVYGALVVGASGFLLKDVTPEHWSPPSSRSRPGTRCSPRRSPGDWSSASRRLPGRPAPRRADQDCRAVT